MPTADDIEALEDAAATAATEGVASATVDGNSATAIPPKEQLDLADRLRARTAAAGTNANGGPVSGWGMARQARAIPPGAV